MLQPLDPRYVPLERAVGFVTTGIIAVLGLGALGFVAMFTSGGLVLLGLLAAAWTAVIAGLAWLALRWPEYEYRRAGYDLGDDAVEIHGGVMWRHVYRVPRSRVQHTDVAQGPLERRYGLATLVLHTAGAKHARVELGGLAHATAIALRDRLLPREHADAV